MNKKFAAAGMVAVMVASLATCSSSSIASARELNKQTVISEIVLKESSGSLLKEMVARSKAQHKEYLASLQRVKNTTMIESTINKLKKHVNKTWYVFGGATPNGWDCSGLVLWTYKQLNIDLYHSASVQKNAGDFVKASDAKPGDIVAFGWNGWKGAGHVGIYLGNGKMIHSPSRGHRTVIEDISSFAKYGYSKVTYTRILDSN
jgi:cell wall-associated NlpC family hydrolase